MPLTFKAPPRISPQQFARVLQRGTHLGPSPAAPLAFELYHIITGYGLDPAVALAFFAHESQYGNDGVCKEYDTRNWGNVRTAVDQRRVVGVAHTPYGDFVRFGSWQDGLRDWCERILHRYIEQWGLDTVEKAIPRYAPSSDGNNEQRYIHHVNELVARWQAEDPAPVDASTWGAAAGGPTVEELQQALFAETFHAAGVEYHPEWAFHQYALKEARAGRPLGAPLSKNRRITVGSKQYAVQVFALDTLYTPIGEPESATNWADVRRMSDLMKQR
ncbi:MAG: hypothetical protein KatS3mg057_0892 [Herpetosiphonaceae bacterium]|nr:MAG: hypothetical protein KatS3mg057_0892 [Herpetosiphonaceae bacterium]